MGSDRLTESRWADAFNGDVVVLLHRVGSVPPSESRDVQCSQTRLN
jgi:hypothetical protein